MRKNAKCRNKNCKKITLTKNSLRDFSSGKPSAEQIFLTVCSVHQKASQSSPPAGGESIEIIFPAACTSEKYRSVRQCAGRPLLADDPCAQRTAISTSEKPAGLFRKKSPRRSGVISGNSLTGPSWRSRRERRTQRHPQLRARRGSCGSSRCRTSSGRS